MALFLKGIIFEGRFEFVIRAKILKLLSHEWSRRWEKKQKEINARDKKNHQQKNEHTLNVIRRYTLKRMHSKCVFCVLCFAQI